MQDREVLITGAGGGLGVEVTAAALEAGARVTAITRGADEDALSSRLGGEAMDRLTMVPGDVTALPRVEAIVADMPRVDVLLHLVGGFGMGPTHTFEPEAYARLVSLNLTSTFNVVRAVLPRMREAGYGRIVTVASRNALEPGPQTAVYGATKAAVLSLTRSVAEETRSMDITANSVLPSVIDTPANRAAMGDEEAHRWVSPASLARTIVDLGREAARDLRGSAVQVYGRV
ncbi:MAG: SDR family NAD(P)-dependent oxidoreductase [Nannocystaceae bacterium]|nr:SDR family NAD(P)-dependent oxidoreductase [bacterium]